VRLLANKVTCLFSSGSSSFPPPYDPFFPPARIENVDCVMFPLSVRCDVSSPPHPCIFPLTNPERSALSVGALLLLRCVLFSFGETVSSLFFYYRGTRTVGKSGILSRLDCALLKRSSHTFFRLIPPLDFWHFGLSLTSFYFSPSLCPAPDGRLFMPRIVFPPPPSA